MSNRLDLPVSPDELTQRLRDLHEKRRKVRKERRKLKQGRRRPLTEEERREAFSKTGGNCHLCGGDINESGDGELPKEHRFVVDHVVPKAVGGEDAAHNYLAAHGLCNGCKWFYSPEEFQWILRMGVWARKQMEDATKIGREIRVLFLQNEEAVRKRRKPRQEE
jgi:5-methylcytosine-specific restriction endonuclease McrA